jgi:hypothetical protein
MYMATARQLCLNDPNRFVGHDQVSALVGGLREVALGKGFRDKSLECVLAHLKGSVHSAEVSSEAAFCVAVSCVRALSYGID